MKIKIVLILIIPNILLATLAIGEMYNFYEDTTIIIKNYDLLTRDKDMVYETEIIYLGVDFITKSKSDNNIITTLPLRSYAPIYLSILIIINSIVLLFYKQKKIMF